MDNLIGLGVTSVTNQTDYNMTGCDKVDTSVHLFFMPVYTLVFLVSLVLNSFIIKVYFCSGKKQVSSIMVVYLKNLAASDFVLCLCLPLNIANYSSKSITFRLVYCIFGATTFYLNIYASILFMGYIAASRYLKIIHPLRPHTLQTVKAASIISTVTWVFLVAITICYVTLFLLTLPELTIYHDSCDPLQSAQVILFDKIIHTFSALTFLFVLVSLIFFYYSASRSVLVAQQRQLTAISCNRLKRSRKKMLVLVSVFCICFVPYHLVSLPYIFLKRQCSLNQMLYYLKEVTMLFSVVNICLDPLIYFFLSKTFRDQLRRSRGKEPRKHNVEQPRATNNEVSLSTTTS